MPVCYGGGVRTVDEMRRLYALGIEKVSLGSAAFEVPDLVREASLEFGTQAVVVTLDVKKGLLGKSTVRTRNGTHDTRATPLDAATRFAQQGAGEILLYSIDRDGTWSGFDLKLIETVSRSVSVPVVATGGAGSLQDVRAAVKDAGASGVAIGSMAVFQGKDLGVLIKFPTRKDQDALFE
jgi:cyclase